MPIFETLPPTEKIDCSESSHRASQLLCRLLPLGLKYDISQVDTKDGHTVKVLFSAQSSDAIVYVTIVVLVYIVLFVALVITSYRNNVNRVNNRRRRRNRHKRPANSVVECDVNSGAVKCLANQSLCAATHV
ncbi:uncharacterized protein LOC128955350 [Oppia nitens]|uniref:uncharacterized protein LOC128955350 n=1 Tax=Oppia nitens TaxID=1686743 RepID=UPI0023DACB89|nr:uncharacterized protein LOC128955350 [Oppia nitens]